MTSVQSDRNMMATEHDAEVKVNYMYIDHNLALILALSNTSGDEHQEPAFHRLTTLVPEAAPADTTKDLASVLLPRLT